MSTIQTETVQAIKNYNYAILLESKGKHDKAKKFKLKAKKQFKRCMIQFKSLDENAQQKLSENVFRTLNRGSLESYKNIPLPINGYKINNTLHMKLIKTN